MDNVSKKEDFPYPFGFYKLSSMLILLQSYKRCFMDFHTPCPDTPNSSWFTFITLLWVCFATLLPYIVRYIKLLNKEKPSPIGLMSTADLWTTKVWTASVHSYADFFE